MLARDAVEVVASDPEWASWQLDTIEAEESLASFIRLMWPVLHPERHLAWGWSMDALCEHVQAWALGEIKNIIIYVPPGHAKSLIVNVFAPAWMWGPQRRPSLEWLHWSYAQDLMVRDNLKFRLLINSPEYRQRWGRVFRWAGDQNEKVLLHNDKFGVKMAAGFEGQGTGRRGDRLVIDDPLKAGDAESDIMLANRQYWVTETWPTRTNDAGAGKLVIMQRLSERDPTGILLGPDWEHLCLPMRYEADHPTKSRTSLNFVDPRTEDGEQLFPERYAPPEEPDALDKLETTMGAFAVAGQHQQRPSPRGGGMFKRHDFVLMQGPPKVVHWVRGWDLAATPTAKNPLAAWTVGALIGITGDNTWCISDVVRIQGSPGEVEDLIRKTVRRDGATVHQDFPEDPGASGVATSRTIAKLCVGIRCYFGKESGSKVDRARPFAAQVEAGNVQLLDTAWTETFLREAESFPTGTFMDQIDACSRAAARLVVLTGQLVPVSAPTLIKAD